MTAVLDLPPLHQAPTGVDPHTALTDARGVIEHAILNHPRSLQTAIGPSEIGNPCDHCLAAKLAGWPQVAATIPWLPTVGTAVHAWIEDAFLRHENNRNAAHTTGLRYLVEHRVMVGHIGGVEVWGNVDLVDLQAALTVDWKLVGATTLKAAKTGPSPTYRVQAHLYAKGCNAAGIAVQHVAIAYLPRNAVTLDAGIWWTEPYDEQVAAAALERANRFATNLTALQPLGDAAVAAYIGQLPRAHGCRDCARFQDYVAPPSPLADLIG